MCVLNHIGSTADENGPRDLYVAYASTFAGWRDLRSVAPTIVRYTPVSGSGDATLNVEFQHGRLIKASGDVHAPTGPGLGAAIDWDLINSSVTGVAA